MEKEFYKQIYSYELEQKKKIIDTVKKQSLELIKEIENVICKMLDIKLYEEFFFNTLKETLEKVNIDNNTIIGVIKKDYDRYSENIEIKYNVKCKIIDDKFIGGLILENKNVLIDNTLKNAIEENVKQKNI